jgi:hypothetical protein
VLLDRTGGRSAAAAEPAAWLDRATPAAEVPPLVLVRPDGYVARATDETDPARRDSALGAALPGVTGVLSRRG